MKGIAWTLAAVFCATAYIALVVAVFNIEFL